MDDHTFTPKLLPCEFHNGGYYDMAALDLASVEKQHIRRILKHTKGNKSEAARILDIGLATLYRKIEEYHLLLNRFTMRKSMAHNERFFLTCRRNSEI